MSIGRNQTNSVAKSQFGKGFRRASVLFSASLAAAIPTSTSAQQAVQDIEVDAETSYAHKTSGIAFHPEVAAMVRTAVRMFKTENDISAMYQTEGGKTFATIYATRVGTPDPYLWFHRVLGTITQREGFQPLMDAGIQAEFFTAPGFDRASGVRASYTIRSGRLRSTGVALMAYGDVLVKVRVTSEELDRNELDVLMNRFIAGFSLPSPLGNEPAPYLVQPCSDKLELAPDAVQKKPTTVMATEQGIIEVSAHVVDEDEKSIPSQVAYCIDANTDERFSIYRPNGSHSGYLLSYNDTGSAVIVGNGGHSFLSELKQGEQPNSGYALVHQMSDRSEIFAGFDKLPTPELAARIPGNQPVIGWTDRDKKITIATGLD